MCKCLREKSDRMSVLEVKLFGAFSAVYEKKPLSFGKNSATKVIKLLQILFYHKESGITREKLLEDLYGREELTDAANNLRVTVHRLKKVLTNAGLPEGDYISIKKSVYKWESPVEVKVDALEMERLISEAENTEDEKLKIRMLEDACRMYVGDFLANNSGDEWVIVEAVRYKKLYSKALHQVCEWKIAHEEYDDVLNLCSVASELYPFDEWQAYKIDCFIAMNRYKDAMKEYEETAHMLGEELGISPSVHMLQQFELLSGRVQNRPQEISNIKSGLQEEEYESGAFFCSVPGFRDAYRVMCRCMERSGQSVFLLVCTLTDNKGRPLGSGERLDLMSQGLHDAIKSSLRRSDSFTKYNPAQYLVMLVGTNEEDCQIVINRIRKNFGKEHRSWEQYLECGVTSLLDYSDVQLNEGLRFAD